MYGLSAIVKCFSLYSAFYPLWNGRMSISFRAQETLFTFSKCRLLGVDSTSVQLDSQPKTVGLVWELAAAWCWFYIHRMNQVNSHDDNNKHVIHIVVVVAVVCTGFYWIEHLELTVAKDISDNGRLLLLIFFHVYILSVNTNYKRVYFLYNHVVSHEWPRMTFRCWIFFLSSIV